MILEGHLILIHVGAYYAHHISNLVIALPDFQTFLRPWAGIGMQKSQYYKLFRGRSKTTLVFVSNLSNAIIHLLILICLYGQLG